MRISPFVIFALGILAIIAFSCTFTVKQWEQTLVLRFGEAQRVENAWGKDPDAGLKFKLPVPLETTVVLDRRNLEVDLPPVELLAADQERLVVDAFVRYRISDPVQFYEALTNKLGAEQKLGSIMDSTLRDVLGRVDTPEIIAERRSELMLEIREVSDRLAQSEELGVEIIDVRIKRADLPQENSERVFKRMVTQRAQEASGIRAEGSERAREIKATAEKTAKVIVAEAIEKSEILRGEGDKERARIFAEAHAQDADFYEFYRSLEAYRRSLKEGSTLVISPDSDFLSYLDDQRGSR